MVMTASTMLPLGSTIPDFSLLNVDGKQVSLSDLPADKPLLVMFICNHCPFVIHLQQALADFGKEYQEKGLTVVAISSNDVSTHPDDSPEKMTEMAQASGWSFLYLYDETQQVAQAFKAACTPDFFLFDQKHQLAYRGQFDDSRPGNGMAVTGQDLREASDAVLAGQAVGDAQKPSIGCNIKWIQGQAPDYFTGVSAE
ncbi:MAG: thioredoxin family protein [Planctomycetaceae bacterium]|nr:thioredoxin family protein [Planctomycetaceae bacterium]